MTFLKYLLTVYFQLDLNNDDVLENGSNASDDCSTDSEDQEYRDLLSRSFQSDESDEDYTCENGSSAETSESSHNENSFFEDGEIEALEEDVVSQNNWRRRTKNATVKRFFASIVDDRLIAACILQSMLNAYLTFSIFGYFDLQKRYNGREIVLETNAPKTNGDKSREYTVQCAQCIHTIN